MLTQMTHSDYLSAPGISKSALDQIAKSPAHYMAWLQHKPEPTPNMIFGTAAHTIMLEPEKFDSQFVCGATGNKNSNAYKDAQAKLIADNPGKHILDPDDFELLKVLGDKFRAHPFIKGLLASSVIEQSFFWEDAATGVHCKGRADIIADGMIFDLKTTKDANPATFRDSIAEWRYHVQGAMYCKGLQAATGKRSEFVFLVVEKQAPYTIAFYSLDAIAQAKGEELMNRDLRSFAHCQAEGNFYTVQPLSLPAWAL